MPDLGPNGFDSHDHDPMRVFEPVPAGTYLAMISESDVRDTRAGDGRYVELRFTIIEGEHSGRTVVARLNLWNPREDVVEMSRAELSAICRAVSVPKPHDTQELHDIPLHITVGIRRRRDTGELVNCLRGYRRRAEAQPDQQQDPGPAPWRAA